jgi:hypothetical protein
MRASETRWRCPKGHFVRVTPDEFSGFCGICDITYLTAGDMFPDIFPEGGLKRT